jgi:hypothetical protein
VVAAEQALFVASVAALLGRLSATKPREEYVVVIAGKGRDEAVGEDEAEEA